jgi:phytoene synthase
MAPEPGDLAVCRRLLRSSSKELALCAWFLPPRVRDPATALYAFCRCADDHVDQDPAADGESVARLRRRLYRVFASSGRGPVERAMSSVVAEHGLPIEPFQDLLEGLSWAATGRQYRDLPELLGYADRVAGSVAVLMAMLMGARGGETLARARDLGMAMQLTHVARHVGEDAQRGRLYLPLEWLAEGGVDCVSRPGRGLAGVLRRLLAAADRLYQRADAGIALLPADCQPAIRAARLIYADLGRSIARAGYDPVTRRAVVSGRRKLWLLAEAASNVQRMSSS